MKDEDDEEYEGSASSPSDDVDNDGSWRDALNSKMKGRQWRRELLRKMALVLAIYGMIVMAVCLSANLFFGAAAH